jgi:ABC-type nitrate/sulfonate/bicarbonate transport system substrate-binding protein
MERPNLKASLYLFLIVFLACFLSPARRSAAQEKKSVRVAFVSLSWHQELPFRAALVRGFFKEQGLAIEPILIRGGPAAIAALASGDVDFGSIGGAQAPIRSRARGLDIFIIGSLSNRVNYTMLGARDVRSVRDLKGKIIGVTGAGAFSDFVVRMFLKQNGYDPDKDVILRPLGGTVLRVSALEKGIIAAAPFSAEEAVGLMKKGFPMISNLSETLAIPQSILVARGEVLEKYPETSKRFLKALILGLRVVRSGKKEAMQAGYDAGLKGDPDIVGRAYDLYKAAYTTDLSVAADGIQLMLDEDIRNGIVDKSMTLDKVVNERVLKRAQDELRAEGRLK